MIVRAFHPPDHELHWVTAPFRDRPCYYCGEPLTVPFVMWQGFGEAIGLHPPCVVELTIRLYRDVHEIECGPYGYVTDGVARLRARLLAEEHAP